MSAHDKLLREVEVLASSVPDTKTLMQRVSDHVHTVMPRYNSISFRLVDEAVPETLVLGPYTGSFNPQPRISFRQCLCGAAATEGKTIVVNNVAEDVRYLTGSSLVKSEIVVPIFVRGTLVGEIDIQSYFVDTFKAAEDRSFVESVAVAIAKYMEQKRKTE